MNPMRLFFLQIPLIGLLPILSLHSQPQPTESAQHFTASFDRGGFWYEGSSPLDANMNSLVDVIDANGTAFSGNLLSVGPRFFIKLSLGGELLYLHVGTASTIAVVHEDPGYASRRVELENGFETYFIPVEGRHRRVIRMTRIQLDERNLPGLRAASAENKFWIESYKMSVQEVKALQGLSLRMDRTTLRSRRALWPRFGYFGFHELKLGEVYEYGGYLGVDASTDRTFSNLSLTGYRNETIDFQVQMNIHPTTGAPSIRLVGHRPSWIRAPWISTDYFSIDASQILVMAEKRPLLLWNSHQRAIFCRDAVAASAAGLKSTTYFGPPT